MTIGGEGRTLATVFCRMSTSEELSLVVLSKSGPDIQITCILDNRAEENQCKPVIRNYELSPSGSRQFVNCLSSQVLVQSLSYKKLVLFTHKF